VTFLSLSLQLHVFATISEDNSLSTMFILSHFRVEK
jgi:hypothetical protein